MNSTGRTWEYQTSHQTAFFLSNLLNSLRNDFNRDDDDDDEVGHFILRFSSSPTSSSPPAVSSNNNKTILIDQFLVIHAIAWLVVDEFDLFHLFLVINGLQKFVADRADFNHDL